MSGSVYEDASSPFAPVLGDAAREMPEAFRLQFLAGPGGGYTAVLEGVMERIWVRPRWLRPVFWLLGRLSLLPGRTGTAVPVTLRIAGHRTKDGTAQQLWRRRFEFERPWRMTTISEYDPKRRAPIDRLGPLLAFEIVWQVTFTPPGTLTLTGRQWRLRAGGLALPLPSRIIGTPSVEHTLAEAGDAVRVSFTNRVPVLGDIFGYEGTFRARREPAR